MQCNVWKVSRCIAAKEMFYNVFNGYGYPATFVGIVPNILIIQFSNHPLLVLNGMDINLKIVLPGKSSKNTKKIFAFSDILDHLEAR